MKRNRRKETKMKIFGKPYAEKFVENLSADAKTSFAAAPVTIVFLMSSAPFVRFASPLL